jgi:hypothetical protein
LKIAANLPVTLSSGNAVKREVYGGGDAGRVPHPRVAPSPVSTRLELRAPLRTMRIKRNSAVLAKLTSKNRLTLPKAVVGQFPGARYFEVRAERGRIVLVPAKVTSLKGVWGKIESLGIIEKDIESAVQWARKRK